MIIIHALYQTKQNMAFQFSHHHNNPGILSLDNHHTYILNIKLNENQDFGTKEQNR